jgi:hypothetical protein
MKPKNRSRVTNRPFVDRYGQSRRATSRRVKDLYAGLLARVGPGPHDVVTEARALRAAELYAVCESLRVKALAGELADVNELTRLESTSARAERANRRGCGRECQPGGLCRQPAGR